MNTHIKSNNCLYGKTVLPVAVTSMQTRHIIQASRRSVRQPQGVLTAFAVALAVAVICTLLLVVSTGTAYALTLKASSTAQTGVLGTAIFMLTAGVVIAFAATMRPLRARHDAKSKHNRSMR